MLPISCESVIKIIIIANAIWLGRQAFLHFPMICPWHEWICYILFAAIKTLIKNNTRRGVKKIILASVNGDARRNSIFLHVFLWLPKGTFEKQKQKLILQLELTPTELSALLESRLQVWLIWNNIIFSYNWLINPTYLIYSFISWRLHIW